jgi:hypothetical protein
MESAGGTAGGAENLHRILDSLRVAIQTSTLPTTAARDHHNRCVRSVFYYGLQRACVDKIKSAMIEVAQQASRLASEKGGVSMVDVTWVIKAREASFVYFVGTVLRNLYKRVWKKLLTALNAKYSVQNILLLQWILQLLSSRHINLQRDGFLRLGLAEQESMHMSKVFDADQKGKLFYPSTNFVALMRLIDTRTSQTSSVQAKICSGGRFDVSKPIFALELDNDIISLLLYTFSDTAAVCTTLTRSAGGGEEKEDEEGQNAASRDSLNTSALQHDTSFESTSSGVTDMDVDTESDGSMDRPCQPTSKAPSKPDKAAVAAENSSGQVVSKKPFVGYIPESAANSFQSMKSDQVKVVLLGPTSGLRRTGTVGRRTTATNRGDKYCDKPLLWRLLSAYSFFKTADITRQLNAQYAVDASNKTTLRAGLGAAATASSTARKACKKVKTNEQKPVN